MSAPITVRYGSSTHAGLRRTVNEDSLLATAPFFLVADGMGGHDAGDLASAAVVAEFARHGAADTVAKDRMESVLAAARRRVAGIAGGSRAAGTTLTGVAVAEANGDAHWLVVNIGDSRTYRLASGALERLTVDHSVVQEMLERGELDAASAASDRRRNVITRAIGAGSDGDADYWMVPARRGDRILVCSDGLHGEVDDLRIAAVLTEEADPQTAATRLVHEAMVAGGRDNITVIVLDAVEINDGDIDEDTVPGLRRSDADVDTRPRQSVGG